MHGAKVRKAAATPIFTLLFTAALLAGCSSGRTSLLALEDEKASMRLSIAQKIGATPLEVRQALDTTAENEARTAAMVTERVVARYGISDDVAMQNYLQGMANKMAAASKMKRYDFKVVLLRSHQVNAFTPGDGQILINEGLLQFTKNEAQVAAVMAHEMAHVVLKHPSRQKQIRLASKAGSKFMDNFTPEGLQENLGRVLRLGGNATMNGMIRQQEMMADSIGLEIMIKTGYNPREMVYLLRALRELSPDRDRDHNVVYGNHPLTIDRETAMIEKINTHHRLVGGVASSAKFEALVRPYHAKNRKRLALQD
jgi:predicted Zn-dependent protease